MCSGWLSEVDKNAVCYTTEARIGWPMQQEYSKNKGFFAGRPRAVF